MQPLWYDSEYVRGYVYLPKSVTSRVHRQIFNPVLKQTYDVPLNRPPLVRPLPETYPSLLSHRGLGETNSLD